ncbi:MAG TPA: Maf family protein [Tepidiformaceae bacterium]|nr:Maf family protein [Tepidiformaceae bacterium]
MTPRRVILASGSPRRRELLGALVPDFEVVVSDIDEPVTGRPVLDARDLALAKGQAVAAAHPDAVVISADTVVARGSEIYGKPVDPSDATRILTELNNRDHLVITGVAVLDGREARVEHSCAAISMRFMYPDEIEGYVATGSPMDKAGAYAIQDADWAPVAKLVGCYCNVMGLPLWRLRGLLTQAGVECGWPDARYDRCRDCPERQQAGK